MNSLATLLVVAVVGASAITYDDIRQISRTCAGENGIAAEDIPKFHSYQYLSTLIAAENQKCYTKCLAENTGFLTPQGYDYVPYVAFAAAKQRQESDSVVLFSHCTGYLPVVNDCSTAFELFKCIMNF